MVFRFLFRLILLAAVIAGVWTVRNRIAEWGIVHYAHSKAGLKLVVGSTRIEPLQGTLDLKGIEIPDPTQPGRLLANVDSVSVSLDTAEFLKRQYRVKNTEIRGIHYKTDDAEAGLFVPTKVWDRFKDRFPDWFSQTLDTDMSGVFSSGFDPKALGQLEAQFPSVRFSREMSEKWQGQVQPLVDQSQGIVQKIKQIRELSQNRDPNANKVEAIIALLQGTENLEAEIKNIVASAASLESQAKKDALGLKELLKADVEKIKQLRPPKIDAEFLSQVLIGPEIKERFAAILAWADSVGESLSEQSDTAHPEHSWFVRRLPGTDVVFPGRLGKPEVLLKRTYFDGDVRFGETPVYFLGRAFDFAVSPKEWGNATTIQLCIDGVPHEESFLGDSPLGAEPPDAAAQLDPVLGKPLGEQALKEALLQKMNEPIEAVAGAFPRIFVTAVLDRRGEAPVDRYYIAAPQYVLPARVLGNQDGLAISVSPGVTRFFGEVEINGEQLSGRIRCTQTGIRLVPSLAPGLRDSALDRLLTDLTRQIDSIDAEMLIGGTKTEPIVEFRSDLGDRLAPQMISVLKDQWDESLQQLNAGLTEETNQSLRTVGGLFREKLDPMLGGLNADQKSLSGSGEGGTVDQVVQGLFAALSPDDQKKLEQRLPQDRREALKNVAGNALQGVLQGLQEGNQGENLGESLKKGLFEGLKKGLK